MPQSASSTLTGVRDARSTFCGDYCQHRFRNVQLTHLRLQIPMADLVTMQHRQSCEQLRRHLSAFAGIYASRSRYRIYCIARNTLPCGSSHEPSSCTNTSSCCLPRRISTLSTTTFNSRVQRTSRTDIMTFSWRIVCPVPELGRSGGSYFTAGKLFQALLLLQAHSALASMAEYCDVGAHLVGTAGRRVHDAVGGEGGVELAGFKRE